MKTKLYVLVSVCIAIMACATGPGEKILRHEPYSEEYIKANFKPFGQKTVTFDDLTYDQVWDACERTLIRLGSTFYMTDKATGEIRARAAVRTDRSDLQSKETRRLSILTLKTDKKISVQASILVPNQWKPIDTVETNDMNNEIDRFMNALKKELKK